MDNSATDEWRAYLKEYEAKRTGTQWTAPPKVHRTYHSDIKKQEAQYNPILQTYTDPKVDSAVKSEEDRKFIQTLAQNKDKALRYEQTFNVVNLENKLKGLEGKPGYPVVRPPNYAKRDVSYTSYNYNIISNKDFKDHHYLPPDSRPQKEEESKQVKTISAIEYRDYDIITGRYIRNHEEKSLLDQRAYKTEAAQRFWKTHDYDLVRGKFIDNQKEEEFQQQRNEEAKVHGLDRVEKLPPSIKYSESSLYQPINMRVVDEQRLNEIDMKNKNAKQRYEMRYDIENEYRHRDIEEQEREKMLRMNRMNVRRYVETRDRGYNIVNQVSYEGRNSEKLPDPQVYPKPSVWERTLQDSKPQPAPVQYPRDIGRRRDNSRANTADPTYKSLPPRSNPIKFIDNGREVINPPATSTPQASRVLRSSGFRS